MKSVAFSLLNFTRFGGPHQPHPLWNEFFGPYPWFYLPLAGEAVADFQLPVTGIFNGLKRALSTDLLLDVPPGGLPHWGQWHSLSLVQFKAALGQNLVRLDKAIISGALVHYAITGEMYSSYKNDVLREEVVIPSTFVVEGIERGIIGDSVFVDHMSKKTDQPRMVFDGIARGHALTEYIADEIYEACRQSGFKRVDVRMLKDRGDVSSGRLTKPIAAQRLNIKKIKDFYNI